MRPPSALRRYLLHIVAPAIAVTAVGVAVLFLQYGRDVHRLEEILQAKALNAADDVRDAVREAGKDSDIRRRALWALCGTPSDSLSVRPSGAFVWEPKKALVWRQNVDDGLARIVSARQYWKDWSPHRKKTPPQRAIETLEVDGSTVHMLWGRVDGGLYALVFNEFPVTADSRTWLWLAAIGFIAGLAAFLVYAAVQLWKAAEKARHDDEMKTRFVSDVSHELKTPLAAMGLWVDMLAGGRLADESRRRHALDVVVEEKGRMLRLVENLLDFTRLEQGRRSYSLETVDVGKVTDDTVDLLRGDFVEHGISVSTAVDSFAIADRDALKGILANLIGNAAKYAASNGPVEVTVRREGEWVQVSVADRGHGIALEEQDRIFERFYRSDSGGVSAKGGFGLGLPISRRLARDMGGDLAVTSRPDGGSIFTLQLHAV